RRTAPTQLYTRSLHDALPICDVVEDRGDLLLGQMGAVQRGALALGEAGATGTAIEEAELPVLAESAGDGEVSGVAASEVGAAGIDRKSTRLNSSHGSSSYAVF